MAETNRSVDREMEECERFEGEFRSRTKLKANTCYN